MARAPASAAAAAPPPPWPDSRHAPRAGGGSPQPAPHPSPPPSSPTSAPPSPHSPDGLCTPPPIPIPIRDSWTPPPGHPEAPPGVGGSRRVLFADALGLPLARLRQYRPWDPRGRGGHPVGGGGIGMGGVWGGEWGEGGEQPPGSWMRPGKGRPQEAEDAQPPPLDHHMEPDPPPAPPPDAEQPLIQGAEEEAVARELELLYLSHLRRQRGEPGDNGDPPSRNGAPPLPERAPNTSLANEMALHYEAGGGRCSPPVLLGRGGPVEGALLVPARPPPRGRAGGLGGALRGCGVLLALAVLVPVAWGDGGGPTAALALGLYLALAWLT
ncbi:basic salivary proline-rich protein 1-like [Melopsittacus undulatus]|uniref:basic salivary proline-rich protein 1-like n=1 Tax=Melopsittacus undulatus TaxID=13146 RepID=UPI00146AA11F|nr:basic salivary proline-rich protein 1-like [Melopsittacus undulatus]